MTRPRVALIGPPGSGKTTVGAELAALLGVPMHDTDQAVEENSGRTIADIFVEDGEARFRELETQEVLRALREHDGVLALGGGAPMTRAIQQALAGHIVVFLDVDIASAAPRIGFDSARPLLMMNPRGQWMGLMRVRRPVYEALATHRVDTSGREPAEIAAEIAGLLS